MGTLLKTVTTGDWIKVGTAIAIAITWLVARGEDMVTMKHDLARHEILLQKVIENNNLALQNQAVLTQRMADHIEAAKGK